jgi:hypothetical protein
MVLGWAKARRVNAKQHERGAVDVRAAVAEAAAAGVVDPYVAAWERGFASPWAWGKGSRLSNPYDGPYTREYDVELVRGRQTFDGLRARRALVATALGVPVDRVLVRRSGADDCRARVVIIERNPVADVRNFSGAQFEDGVIRGVGRLVDGRANADVRVWDERGTVPTVVTGAAGNGRSSALSVLACGALGSGVLNLLYLDPKGNSCPGLVQRARVAIVGAENVARTAPLVSALVERRLQLSLELGLQPSSAVPGWMVAHETFARVRADSRACTAWRDALPDVRNLGIWPVAVNESLRVSDWGDVKLRDTWAEQVIAFGGQRMEATLVDAGMLCNPADLPRDECGRWTRGMAVHRWLDTPVQWDYLPSTSPLRESLGYGHEAPVLTADEAFDSFFNVPEVHAADAEVLESFFGRAVDGRWQVGGPGATHSIF